MRSRGRTWAVIIALILIAGLVAWPALADSLTPTVVEGETPQPAADDVQAIDSETTVEPQTVAPPRPIVVKLEGTITARPPTLLGEWQVDDNTISVTIETVIQPVGYDPQVGDRVVVKALRTPTSSSLIALKMTVEKPGEDGHPVEFRGIINECVEASPYWGNWVVARTKVSVTDQTTVVVAGTPKPGLYAQVRGLVNGDGTVAASYIEVLSPASVAVKFQFKGLVQFMSWGKGLWIIGGVPGEVSSRTEIIGQDKIKFGSLVQVSGERSGIFIQFTRIALVEEPAQIQWEGVIQQVALESAGEWVVGDKSVLVDETTFVDESHGRAQPGMWAQVTATEIEGLYRAQRIRIEQP